METLYINRQDWESFLKGKATGHKLFAPVDSRGLLLYTRIDLDNASDIVYNRARPVEPLKLFFYPFNERVTPGVEEISDFVVMGPASCDLKGLEILDSVFSDGDFKDPNYARRRDAGLVISFDCRAPYSCCFCEMVGVHPYPEKNFDINLSGFEDGFLVDVGSEKGMKFLGEDQRFFQTTSEQLSKREKVRRQVSEQINENNRRFDLSSLDRMPHLHETEFWKVPRDVENCVQCGSCTNNCPTCVCFLLEDTGDSRQFRKTKVWDSCLFPGYAKMAGGASPRPTLYDRYANRLLCKYWYMVDNFGIKGCTGCGRCIDGCIGKIDKRGVLTEVLRENI